MKITEISNEFMKALVKLNIEEIHDEIKRTRNKLAIETVQENIDKLELSIEIYNDRIMEIMELKFQNGNSIEKKKIKGGEYKYYVAICVFARKKIKSFAGARVSRVPSCLARIN